LTRHKNSLLARMGSKRFEMAAIGRQPTTFSGSFFLGWGMDGEESGGALP
jgi:hypothetical protein